MTPPYRLEGLTTGNHWQYLGRFDAEIDAAYAGDKLRKLYPVMRVRSFGGETVLESVEHFHSIENGRVKKVCGWTVVNKLDC